MMSSVEPKKDEMWNRAKDYIASPLKPRYRQMKILYVI